MVLLMNHEWVYFFSFGSRLCFFRYCMSIHSICPLVLRNSSAAHFSIAFIISSFTRSAKGFFFDIINKFCSSFKLRSLKNVSKQGVSQPSYRIGSRSFISQFIDNFLIHIFINGLKYRHLQQESHLCHYKE